MTREEIAYVWLSMTEGLGPRGIARLLSLQSDVTVLMEQNASDWTVAVGAKVAAAMEGAKGRVDDMIAQMEKKNVRMLIRSHPEYPPLLLQVYDPPVALFVRGTASLAADQAVAIVGSRRCTRYGLDMAHMLGKDLSSAGVCVVSGLARGIDTSAHMGALAGGGETIAVLGCGVDIVYPPENAKLYDKIAEQGALVSEYLPGTPPLAGHFPLRNRIISGMSQAVILVEASRGSGAMITVDYALEHGREVFAVPGNVTAKQSSGPNGLIYEGKCMVRDAQDVLFGLGWAQTEKEKPKNRISVQLSAQEAIVAGAVANEEHSFEELQKITGFSTPELNSLLTMLTLRGIMKQAPGRVFSLNRL